MGYSDRSLADEDDAWLADRADEITPRTDMALPLEEDVRSQVNLISKEDDLSS